MRRSLSITLLMTAAMAGGWSLPRAEAGGQARAVPVSYYGENDLRDYYQAGQIMRKFSGSTAALFSDKALTRDAVSGDYKLKSLSLKDKYNLRAGEPFASQPVGAYCSGVLVGEDVVLTAGHCLSPDERGGPCGRVRFVFGYAVTREGEIPSAFPAENVYSCSRVIAQRVMDERNNFTCRGVACSHAALAGKGPDYALVKLDRKAAGRVPLAISRDPVAKDTMVGVIGYPGGMPVKVQERGASVRNVTRRGYFVANLDTFMGNSGSPVFNMKTLKIEGILARGGADYVYDSSPTAVQDPANPYYFTPGRANVYPQDGGEGEDVTFITELRGLIPQTEMEKYLDTRAGGDRQGQVKPVPAVYVPGQNGGFRPLPADYSVPEVPAPEPIRI